MREFNVSQSEITRVIGDVLRFNPKWVSHRRAKLELETALTGAVERSFFLEVVEWPRILTRPEIDEPEELEEVGFEKMKKDISAVIKFTRTMDLHGETTSTKLLEAYGHQPRVKSLFYGLCQHVLAEAGFEFESPQSLFVRHTVAGWFEMTDITNEWSLRALLCLIDYFQENSRTYLYPPLREYLRKRKNGRKLQTEILKLMRRVDWNALFKTDSLNELIGEGATDALDGMMIILSEGWSRMTF